MYYQIERNMDAKNPIEPFAGEEKGAGSLSLIKHLECIVDATQGKNCRVRAFRLAILICLL